MSMSDWKKHLECRCVRCRYNNNGRCGYQGRILITQNGECAVMETGYDRGPGPYG